MDQSTETLGVVDAIAQPIRRQNAVRSEVSARMPTGFVNEQGILWLVYRVEHESSG